VATDAMTVSVKQHGIEAKKSIADETPRWKIKNRAEWNPLFPSAKHHPWCL
jgi:hypothetical protein